MGSSTIQAKIRAGLKRAQKKTSSPTSEKVYLIKSSTTSGTPLAPGVTTTSQVELTNAIFIDFEAKRFDINILAGDRELICDNVNIVKQGDVIKQGALTYYVVNIEIIAPTSDVLAYLPQLRLK